MKLALINELKFGQARRKKAGLLDVMPSKKKKHSLRVAKSLHQAGASDESIHTGFLHDYLERGGNIEELQDHVDELGLPISVLYAIQSLSNDEKNTDERSQNESLIHLQTVLQSCDDDDTKNIILITKLADRLDNLRKRQNRAKKISKSYCRKSTELIEFIKSNYNGEMKPFKKLMKLIKTTFKACRS